MKDYRTGSSDRRVTLLGNLKNRVMSKEQEVKDKLRELVDEMEELYGELQGFEVRLQHPVVEGQRQVFADIVEFNIMYLHREQIKM